MCDNGAGRVVLGRAGPVPFSLAAGQAHVITLGDERELGFATRATTAA